MGIDIYAKWRGMTEEDKQKQYTGFSITAGGVGYLREAYHGAPYATRELVAEAFDSETGTSAIPSATLRERLPKVLETVAERQRKVYPDESEEDLKAVQDSFTAFVELCEKMEEVTGEPVEIVASY